MSDLEQKQKLKIELAKESNKLGRQRLNAAIMQAVLTTCNLLISLVILYHILG